MHTKHYRLSLNANLSVKLPETIISYSAFGNSCHAFKFVFSENSNNSKNSVHLCSSVWRWDSTFITCAKNNIFLNKLKLKLVVTPFASLFTKQILCYVCTLDSLRLIDAAHHLRCLGRRQGRDTSIQRLTIIFVSKMYAFYFHIIPFSHYPFPPSVSHPPACFHHQLTFLALFLLATTVRCRREGHTQPHHQITWDSGRLRLPRQPHWAGRAL